MLLMKKIEVVLSRKRANKSHRGKKSYPLSILITFTSSFLPLKIKNELQCIYFEYQVFMTFTRYHTEL